MTTLLDRLAHLFEQGHAREIGGLLTDARFADLDRTADAAVLIAVTDRARPGVILTQRPHTMRDHPGQVAFPGGKREPGEDAIAAALREAEEELALAPKHVAVIGTTDRYQTGTGFDITPVLGVVPADLPLEPDAREVESWFEAPLDAAYGSGKLAREFRGLQGGDAALLRDGFRRLSHLGRNRCNLRQSVTPPCVDGLSHYRRC